MKVSSRVPYLLLPLLEWLVDNDLTPYLIVNTLLPEVIVPPGFAQPDGRIIFNISSGAVRNLSIEKRYVLFDGRFSGSSFEVCVPIDAVLALVSKETGDGMWFPENEYSPSEQQPSVTTGKDSGGEDPLPGKKKKKPSFTIVK